MSQHVELPDAVYDNLRRVAEQEGRTPAGRIAEKLPKLSHITPAGMD